MMHALLTRHFCVTCFKIVALDPVPGSSLPPCKLDGGNAGFRANSAIFFSFLFFIMDAIEGRNLKVGLDENTGLTCKLANIQELNIFLIM